MKLLLSELQLQNCFKRGCAPSFVSNTTSLAAVSMSPAARRGFLLSIRIDGRSMIAPERAATRTAVPSSRYSIRTRVGSLWGREETQGRRAG